MAAIPGSRQVGNSVVVDIAVDTTRFVAAINRVARSADLLRVNFRKAKRVTSRAGAGLRAIDSLIPEIVVEAAEIRAVSQEAVSAMSDSKSCTDWEEVSELARYWLSWHERDATVSRVQSAFVAECVLRGWLPRGRSLR